MNTGTVLRREKKNLPSNPGFELHIGTGKWNEKYQDSRRGEPEQNLSATSSFFFTAESDRSRDAPGAVVICKK